MAEKQKKYRNWTLDTDDRGILWCYLDVPDKSANVVSSTVLEEFGGIIADIESACPTGLVIASAKQSGFIAGADVDEFITTEDSEQALAYVRRVHDLFNRLEALRCPSLSLINGFCLGGGLELALACRHRVALDDPKTRIGLPEVLLGIHPGFGGSMRMIRLIGPLQAMPLMLAGRTLDARRAKKLGLVDKVVPQRQLHSAAQSMIQKQVAPARAPLWARLANHNLVRPLLARYMRNQLRKKANEKHYPAPFALIDVWENHGGDETEMLDAEARSIAKLFITDTSRNLVRLFKLQERLKSRKHDVDFQAQHVHVIGAGVMGGDIAAWCALQGLTVTLQDREPKFIAPALQRAHTLFKRKLKQTRLITAAMDRLVPDHKGLGVERADIVIEAIIENAEAKIELFRGLEARIKDNTILATNTSSIPLQEIGRQLQSPERLCGVHFFNPVAQMQLVEIVHSEQTANAWVEKASAFCQQISRLPVPVKSSPGFLVNRILTPYLLEAVALWEEGATAEQIDRAAKAFGMPMGPVELADTVGLDICLSVAKNMAATLNISIPEKLGQMVEKGHLGKKSGQGFYTYKKGRPLRSKKDPATEVKDIEDRMVLRILNECVACLREQIVEDSDLLDAGMVFGTGFAPFRGGPIHYARQCGPEQISARLSALSTSYGERFTPDPGWQELIPD